MIVKRDYYHTNKMRIEKEKENKSTKFEHLSHETMSNSMSYFSAYGIIERRIEESGISFFRNRKNRNCRMLFGSHQHFSRCSLMDKSSLSDKQHQDFMSN